MINIHFQAYMLFQLFDSAPNACPRVSFAYACVSPGHPLHRAAARQHHHAEPCAIDGRRVQFEQLERQFPAVPTEAAVELGTPLRRGHATRSCEGVWEVSVGCRLGVDVDL